MAECREEWAKRMTALLKEEHELEQAEFAALHLARGNVEKMGMGLQKLHLVDTQTGLFARTLATFETKNGRRIPTTKLTTGAVVQLVPNSPRSSSSSSSSSSSAIKTHDLPSGTLIKLSDKQVVVSFEDLDLEQEQLTGPLTLMLVPNEVTYRRINAALHALACGDISSACEPLVRTLFQPDPTEEKIIPRALPEGCSLQMYNENLNDIQKSAVVFALETQPVAMIHGPPGTGKTTAVVELILQAVARGERVLAVAGSNIAVDNIAERILSSHKPPHIVRVGHPARFLSSVMESSLDAQMRRSDAASIVDDVKAELAQVNRKILSHKGSARRAARLEAKELRREIGRRHAGAVHEILQRARVVLCTTTGAQDRAFSALPPGHSFDLVVIDEAAQALEASCWIALLRGKRAVLAGDHLQLPPVVKSDVAVSGGLSVTLFERLLKGHPQLGTMLTIQYRMHSVICSWASNELYDGRLVPADSVASHTLDDLPNVRSSDTTREPVIFIDTAGCDCEEDLLPNGSQMERHANIRASLGDVHSGILDASRSNDAEARIVQRYVGQLREAGVCANDIGIITPYNAQVELLRNLIWGEEDGAEHTTQRIEIGSVDGFQGREKEVIVISLVRSNSSRNVGFLCEDRRMNVAVTRARRQVAIIGDSSTVESHPFLARLITYMGQVGEVRSALEYGACGGFLASAARKSVKSDRKLTPKFTAPDKQSSIASQIRAFADDDSKKFLSLSPDLNAYDRALAHELAEKLGLVHSSTGEGEQRRLELQKNPRHRHEIVQNPKQNSLAKDDGQVKVTCQESQEIREVMDEEIRTTASHSDVRLGAAEEDLASLDTKNNDVCPSSNGGESRVRFQNAVADKFAQLIESGMSVNDAAAEALRRILVEMGGESNMSVVSNISDDAPTLASSMSISVKDESKGAPHSDSLASSIPSLSTVESDVPSDSNLHLAELHAERVARKASLKKHDTIVKSKQVKEEKVNAARAKRDRRKAAKQSTALGQMMSRGGHSDIRTCAEEEDIDTLLQKFAADDMHGTPDRTSGNPLPRRDVLPWSHERESCAHKEKLRERLRSKAAQASEKGKRPPRRKDGSG